MFRCKQHGKAIEICPQDEVSFIIGGGEIYKLGSFRQIELTLVHHNFEADAFPEIDLEDWEIINSEFQPKGRETSFDYTYQTYIRK
jgi:dihydrofolate reductase